MAVGDAEKVLKEAKFWQNALIVSCQYCCCSSLIDLLFSQIDELLSMEEHASIPCCLGCRNRLKRMLRGHNYKRIQPSKFKKRGLKQKILQWTKGAAASPYETLEVVNSTLRPLKVL